MNRYFTCLLLFAIFLTVFAVMPMAEPINFVIANVDLPVESGQVVVCTTLANWQNSNPYWSNNLQCTPCGKNVYKVISASQNPVELVGNGNASNVIQAAGFTDAEGDIYIILHGGEQGENSLQFSIGVDMYVFLSDISAGATVCFSDNPDFYIPDVEDSDDTAVESSDESSDNISDVSSDEGFHETSNENSGENNGEVVYIKGDINNNEEIDSLDYLYLKRAFFKQYVLPDESKGDINKNGNIDSMDYLYLKRAFFKQYVIQ